MKKNTVNADESNIKIRNCLKRDLPDIFELLQSISDYIPDEKDIDMIWNNFIEQKNLNALVLVEMNKVIGYGSIIFETKIRGGIHGHIEDIAIQKDYQNKGFGSYLIDTLIQVAKKRNCYKVSLGCDKKNIKFYKKIKFAESGTFMQLFF
jgi:ribosomal protein S18 acetylase RimI-like enzyme